MCSLVKVVLVFTGIALRHEASSSGDFFDNYIEVSTPPPESIEAIPKCGEGVQKGKYVCVPYFNCDPTTNTVMDYPEVDGSIIKNPRSIDDPRCGHHLQVCCQIVNTTTVSVGHGPTVNLEFEPTCGVKPEGNGGGFALFGEIPWMVALLNASSTNNRPFCGGSLLTPVVVLTAAHCVQSFQPNEIKVRVGEWDLETTNESIPYQERTVSEVIIHEHYFSSALYNDVAILILNNSLHGTDNVGTVCLSQSLENINQEDCFLTGWGQISNNVYAKRLKKLNLSKITNELCQEALRKEIGKEFLLDQSFICARTNSGHDVCVGDGGGALVCQGYSKRYFQIGILSWGIDCADSTPSVYVNAIQFRDWISMKLALLGYNSNPFTQ